MKNYDQFASIYIGNDAEREGSQNGDLSIGAVVLRRFRLEHSLGSSHGTNIWEGLDLDSEGPEEGRVIVKIAKTEGAQKTMAKEHSNLTGRLAGVSGIPRVMAYGLPGEAQGLAALVTTPYETPIKKYIPQGRATPKVTLEWAARLCSTLSDIHDRGFVHRNVNPGTITIIPSTGEVFLSGFGSVTMSEQADNVDDFMKLELRGRAKNVGYTSERIIKLSQSSQTFRACARDDFESLAWSLMAMEIGWRQYEEGVASWQASGMDVVELSEIRGNLTQFALESEAVAYVLQHTTLMSPRSTSSVRICIFDSSCFGEESRKSERSCLEFTSENDSDESEELVQPARTRKKKERRRHKKRREQPSGCCDLSFLALWDVKRQRRGVSSCCPV